MARADDRSRLIATSTLAKAELSLLRSKPETVAAVNPVEATAPQTPRFDLSRSASSLLFTLFVERADIGALPPEPGTLEPPDERGDQNSAKKAAARTATMYSARQLDVPESLPPAQGTPQFSQQANVPMSIAQASVVAQSGLLTVLGQVSRGLDVKKIESFLNERPEVESSAQMSDRNLLVMAVLGAAATAILLWIGILN